jgi:thioredoxin-dependent peroxiredoxin
MKPMLKNGQKAPDFKLKTDSGSELSLQELVGRRVVIFFFPKANTPG